MTRTHSMLLPVLWVATLAAACSGPATSVRPDESASRAERVEGGRTLVVVTRGEPDTIANKEVLRVTGLSFSATPRLFNAGLSILDGQENPRPYLVEALPELRSNDWRLLDDGRMETIYRLRPNLVWHDGTPLHAEDLVFAWRVYTTPELGQANAPPVNLMEDVAAPDARTLVIRWRGPYSLAGAIRDTEFQALPRHLLEQSFRTDSPEVFGRGSFWSTGYIGLGPYRLDRWEPGAFLEGKAFDQHVGGRPRIDRIRLLFISDFNTALAAMLAGDAHIAVDDAVRFQQGAILRREWAQRNGGTVLTTPDQWRRSEFQQRVDYATPKGILDLRVRRALAHAVDKDALNLGLFEGEAILADTFIPPTVGYREQVERAITKYGYDVRSTEQLMRDAGWPRGADGVYANPSEGRFSVELKVNATAQAEAEMAIMAAGWRTVGFEVREIPVPQAQSRLGEVRGTFPTFYTGGGGVGDRALPSFLSSTIASAETRWVGNNRTGFSNPGFDRLAEAYATTLDRTERQRQLTEMARIFSEELPAISLYFNPGIVAFAASLHGPLPFGPDADVSWNVHEWELR